MDLVQTPIYVCKMFLTEPPRTLPPTSAEGACPSTDWGPRGPYCYLFITDDELTWSQAEFRCVQQGAHLASVTDKAENDWIQSQIQARQKNVRNVWLGLLKQGTGDY